jgi:hypothetical protein
VVRILMQFTHQQVVELLSIKGLLQKRIKDAKEVVIECHASLSGLKRAYEGVKDASFDIQFTSLRDLMVHLDNCSKVLNTGIHLRRRGRRDAGEEKRGSPSWGTSPDKHGAEAEDVLCQPLVCNAARSSSARLLLTLKCAMRGMSASSSERDRELFINPVTTSHRKRQPVGLRVGAG